MTKPFSLVPPLPSNAHFSNASFPLSLGFSSESSIIPFKFSSRRNLISCATAVGEEPPAWTRVVATSAVVFLGLGAFRINPAASAPLLPSIAIEGHALQEDPTITQGDLGDPKGDERFENEEMKAKFEAWKSKTYALSVPLKVVALRGSIPPSWAKDFMQSQGRRLRFRTNLVGSLEDIFSDLSASFGKRNVGPTSAVAADIVSVGDSWLSFAIKKAIIEPIKDVEDQDWFKGLSEKWKEPFGLSIKMSQVYLRRNHEGEIDPEGKIWAAPYRWGCMVIAYKKNKFKKHNLAPIKDWADLWRPDLAGRISMVDSPREVVGAVLKYMGASYNAQNIDLQVSGGRNAVQQNLVLLGKQVRLFDSMHYLKAFGVGDVWVAVGWSSDVLPVAKRMSNVAVIVPNSGASLWSDLWAIPAASRLETSQIGHRVRGPSPIIHQWIEFCLQAARALPFKQEVIPGATPSALESSQVEVPQELIKGKPKLDTNLIAGVPPPDILHRCEFLEPLPDATLLDYKLLVASLQNPNPSLIHRVQHFIFSMIQTLSAKD